jgi:hypothetical protein
MLCKSVRSSAATAGSTLSSSTSGGLGIGTRKIAVDWHALNFAPVGKPGSITLNLTRSVGHRRST